MELSFIGPAGFVWMSSAPAIASWWPGRKAAMSREVFARMYKIKAFGRGRGQERISDAADQFDHLRALADGEKEDVGHGAVPADLTSGGPDGSADRADLTARWRSVKSRRAGMIWAWL